MTQHSGDRVVLVTGGAGFIGSHLVEHLTRRGDRVLVIDNLSTGRRENLRDVDPSRITLIDAELQDGINEIAGQHFDEIYHLAAAVGVRLVVEQPIRTIETNVLDTSALLRFAAEQKSPTLLASTSEVYGKGGRTPFAEDDDVVYGPTRFSRWSYACSKAIDEYLALAYHREHGLPMIILRFFNTVGPRQTGEYGMVLPRFVRAAVAGQPIEVHGDGRQSRCFCDVRDVVPAVTRMLEWTATRSRRVMGSPKQRSLNSQRTSRSQLADDSSHPIFNIGRDEPITINDLARLVKRVLDSDSPIVHVPYEHAFGDGFDDLRTRQPDLSRLRRAIEFEPQITLEQTILDVAAEMAKRETATR